MSESFWMYDWLDERGIRSPADAKRVLARPRGLRSLQAAAQAAADAPRSNVVPLDHTEGVIAAGRSMDLSGVLDCMHWECLTRKLDDLFRNVWHYFDEVVVEGPGASRVTRQFERDSTEHVGDRMLHHATALLRLREQGLDKYLIFREKPPECTVHYEQHLEEAGLTVALASVDDIIEDLVVAGEVRDVSEHDDHWHYEFVHPRLEHTVWETLPAASGWDGGGDPLPFVARDVLRRFAAHLTSDVRAARGLQVPLASSVELHEEVLDRTAAGRSVENVALSLQLPVLQNLTAADLVRLREHEGLQFERFRDALRSAIAERLKSDGEDPVTVAARVMDEIINPELNMIEAKLGESQRSLSLKSGLQLGVGAATTTVGLLAALPPVVATGLGISAASVVHGSKYFDDKKEVRLSEMYFLWHAEHRNAQRAPRKRLGRRRPRS